LEDHEKSVGVGGIGRTTWMDCSLPRIEDRKPGRIKRGEIRQKERLENTHNGRTREVNVYVLNDGRAESSRNIEKNQRN